MYPLESKLGMSAEQMLRALDRAIQATPMLLGILAEVAFEDYVLARLEGWTSHPSPPGAFHDFSLQRDSWSFTVQVKLQRSKKGQPEIASKRAWRWKFSPGMYKVEMQRSRGGEDAVAGEKTRPYRFGEFDILAVSMYPSTKKWGQFLYTVSNWLIPDPVNPSLMATFQPVPPNPNDDWTDDIPTCVRWLQTAERRTIGGGHVLPKKPKKKKAKPKKKDGP